MKKGILIFVLLQFVVLKMCAIDKIDFNYLIEGGTSEIRIPVTGTIEPNGKQVVLNVGKSTNSLSVSVKDKFGSVVYKDQLNSGDQTYNIDMKNYANGDYTISIEDTEGNAAIGDFQIRK